MPTNDNARPVYGTKQTAHTRNSIPPGAWQMIDLFDPAEVRHKLNGGSNRNLNNTPDRRGVEFALEEPATLSQEETAWRQKLQSLVDGTHNPKRRLLVATPLMLAGLAALKGLFPHFGAVINLVIRTAKLSETTQSPLLIPPILFVGGPGIGKTYFARQLAGALGTHVEFVAMDTLTDRGAMTGLSLAWRGARPGRVASGLLESSSASPVFILDEVDKVSAIHHEERPLAFLHSVLEQENSSRFSDEYLTIALRADHAIWVLTANSIDGLPPSILVVSQFEFLGESDSSRPIRSRNSLGR
jgi:ATP-dependent Lon protease